MKLPLWKNSLPLYYTAIALLCGTAQAAVDTYKIDPAHSSVSFSVRHFFSPVPGNFSEFEGTILYDPENPVNNSAKAVIHIGSVDTNSEKRDRHLRSDEFFHALTHPTMTFESTNWESVGENKFKVTGDLTILKTTKSIVLDVTLLGAGEVGQGDRKKYISGWTATASLKRTEFGIDYGVLSMIGDDVSIEITVEAVRQ